MIDYLATDVTNPMFYGYMSECETQEKIEGIKEECGACISASELTEKLIEKGLDPESLAPHELDLIDETFSCL